MLTKITIPKVTTPKVTIIYGLILFSVGTFANVPSHQVEVSVPGMVCQMCVHGMRKVFKKDVTNPQTDVQVNLDSKILRLNLAKALSDEEIRKKIKDAGYEAVTITRKQAQQVKKESAKKPT